MRNPLIAPLAAKWPWARNAATMFLPSPIKSIQRNTITLNNGTATNTATITAVDPNHSTLRLVGASVGNVAVASNSVRLTFTSATVITATRVGTGSQSVVSFEVVEYWPGVIRSIQRSTSATGTATITAVQSLTRTTLDHLGGSNDDGTDNTDMNGYPFRLELTNTTTITRTRTGTAGTLTWAYQVVEWW